jgi:hypothetical protein
VKIVPHARFAKLIIKVDFLSRLRVGDIGRGEPI